MPFIDLQFCPVCSGTLTAVLPGDGDSIAGKIEPCRCGTGLLVTDEQGRDVSKIDHATQEAAIPTSPRQNSC